MFLRSTPRSDWLSLAGGASVAHVFVHLLPELAAHQQPSGGRRSTGPDLRPAGGAGRPRETAFKGTLWLHPGPFAICNGLGGYPLLHREETDLRGLLIYGLAMGLHVIVSEQGRWTLAAVPLLAIAALFAFLAGGVVLNVLKEELPEERESRIWAFAAGTGLHAALLLPTG